ncbi:MAG: hypothetical protein WAP23_03140 [Candidatus Spechtbacterales bacterium]
MKRELLKNKKIDCAFCKGSGTQSPGGLLVNTCAVCRGNGTHHLDRAMRCVYCGGRGRHILNRSIPCACCGGIGAVKTPKAFATCDQCEGRGSKPAISLACIGCRGKGIREIKEA